MMSLVRKGRDHLSVTGDITGVRGVLTMSLYREQLISAMYSEEVFSSPHLCSLLAGLGTAEWDMQQWAGE